MSPELPKPDGCTPEVSWEVCWPSAYAEGQITHVPRRDQGAAIDLAKRMKHFGADAKLYRIERTEIDF